MGESRAQRIHRVGRDTFGDRNHVDGKRAWGEWVRLLREEKNERHKSVGFLRRVVEISSVKARGRKQVWEKGFYQEGTETRN